MTRSDEVGQPVGEPVDWTRAGSPEARVLEGRCVRLEPLGSGHAAGILALGRHPDSWTYLGDEPPTDLEAARALTRVPEGWLSWAVIRDGRMQGRVSFLRVRPGRGSIEVGGILYSPELRRTRAATEVQYLLARYAFSLGYRRYEWKCDSLNTASRRAALRLGFTEEGTWRKALVYKGRNRDTTWFSLTDDEWPVARAALERWLDDDNHGPATIGGTQRVTLEEIRGSLR